MPLQAEIKSRSVLGATELTLLAPIKPGLAPTQDTRSYLTRARIVLATLHALGISRREIELTPAIAEVADEIRTIRSFRLAVVGERTSPQVLLSVSFDGGWEPYMRKIWRDLGPLLDLIFCNCQGYLLSRGHGYAAYADWVRRHQVETGFYYEGSPLTVEDMRTLREQAAAPGAVPAPTGASLADQARGALVGLYRLSDLFPPGSQDGDVLLAAARMLLDRLASFVGPLPARTWRTPTEQAAWNWFCKKPAAPVKCPAVTKVDLSNVQAGILKRHHDRGLACLALVELDDATGARALIDHVLPMLRAANAKPWTMAEAIVANLAFTFAGLERAGLDEATLRSFPQEFQEGMDKRASILGDLLHNHPRAWTWPAAYPGSGASPVAPSRVHAIVQFQCLHRPSAKDQWQAHTASSLLTAIAQLQTALGGHGRVAAVQPMQRYVTAAGAASGHFGFVDGLSQPALQATGGALVANDLVEPGDLLLGYANSLGDAPRTGRLWKDSTFVVVRKLRQYAGRLRTQLPQLADREALMGRHADGRNLMTGTSTNAFDYQTDPLGQTCPLHAHVRRAHPRTTRPDLKALPRILRRGMSYGPRPTGRPDDDDTDRGLVFIAYNASIAEQFELVQGWLAGANSSGPGSLSGLRDPFLGVRLPGDPASYRMPAWAPSHRAALPADEPLVTLQWGLYAFVPSLAALQELRACAEQRLQEDAVLDLDEPPPCTDPTLVSRLKARRAAAQGALAAKGAALIARLRQVERAAGQDAALEQWKTVLEDAGARAAGLQPAVWAAVRQVHGGVLRTPYGVLVASADLVNEVFNNAAGRYSVSGYNDRLARSFGEIYLGRDQSPAYGGEATLANGAIMGVTRREAFNLARRRTAWLLHKWAPRGQDCTLEFRDLTDGLLERLCRHWFGLPDGLHVQAGGWHQHSAAHAACPGHFYAPSRYTFQPHPGEAVREMGQEHGQKLHVQVTDFVQAVRGLPFLQGSLGRKLFTALLPPAPAAHDFERLASTLIGVMMGFLPTVDGVLRGLLHEWVQEGTLWEHQAALSRAGGAKASLVQVSAVLEEPMRQSMHRRPVPELVWRTVVEPHPLGSGGNAVDLRAGDRVVVGIASALQQALAEGRTELQLLFGGDRRSPTPAVPLHACPGQDMAMGVMLGFLAALLSHTAALRPASSPQALRFGP